MFRRASSSSTVLHFPPMSLFLVLLLFFSLSFFVADGLGENEVVMHGESENKAKAIGRLNRMGMVVNNGNEDDNDDDNGTTTVATIVTSSSSAQNSESGSGRSPTKNSVRNQESNTSSWEWRWKWDSEWEKEAAAGLTTLGTILDGRLVSIFLGHGVLGRFVYMNNDNGNWLSFTVTPCTSLLQWSVTFLPFNGDGGTHFKLKTGTMLKTFRTDRIITFNQTDCRQGFYTLEIRPLVANTYVHYLLSTIDIDDPVRKSPELLIPNAFGQTSFTYNYISNLGKKTISTRKLRGNRLSIKWESTPMNPQITQYCVVVNTRKDYFSLCEAKGERYGVVPPDLMHLPYYLNKRRATILPGDTRNNAATNLKAITVANDPHLKSNAKLKVADDILVGCLKGRRNYVLNDLQNGQLYYINVFAKNMLTNLTYPYLQTTHKYSPKKREAGNLMRDSKPKKVLLPDSSNNQSWTILKFNLKKPCVELTMYAMPCDGGSFVYEVMNGNKSVYQSEEITSLDIIKIAMPSAGQYWIVASQQVPGIRSKSKTQIPRRAEFLVSKKNKRFPLPRLPVIRKVVEDKTQRTCDSVTIEWWPASGDRDNEYCIYLKIETRQRTFNFKEPNQCDLEKNLKNDRRISHSYCLQRTANGKSEKLRQKLNGLHQSTTYVLQLIVRRQNGMALSYDMHYVTTADKCETFD